MPAPSVASASTSIIGSTSLTEPQLADYFTELMASHSWSAVKLDLYGLKFYYEHVLRQPWVAPGLIKPPRVQRLPDIVTVEEARRIIAATRVRSYQVFFFTLYSLGLRLGVAATQIVKVVVWLEARLVSLEQPLEAGYSLHCPDELLDRAHRLEDHDQLGIIGRRSGL